MCRKSYDTYPTLGDALESIAAGIIKNPNPDYNSKDLIVI